MTRIQPFFLLYRFTLDIASNLTKKQFSRTDSLSRLVWKSSRKSCTVSRIWLSYSLVMFPRSQRTPFNNSLFIFFILLTFPPRRPSFPFLISSSTYFINIPSTTQLRIFGLLYLIYYTFFWRWLSGLLIPVFPMKLWARKAIYKSWYGLERWLYLTRGYD